MLAGSHACSAAYAFACVKYNQFLSFQCLHWTGFNTALTGPAALAARALAVFPAAFLIVYLYWHMRKVLQGVYISYEKYEKIIKVQA